MDSLRTIVALVLIACPVCVADGEEEPPPKLLGRCTIEQLREEPFGEWAAPGYDDYRPNAEIVETLRAMEWGDVEIHAFFGTWCGDSRREIPRLARLAHDIGLPAERLHLIAVDDAPEAIKRSPDGEERGVGVFRVPTIVVRRGGREVARIVEHPLLSLERDLSAILHGADYPSSYPVYPRVQRWLEEGLLSDPNVSARGLAELARREITGEGDLSAAAKVLLSRGETAEAAKLYETNCELYWESASAHARLADARIALGDAEGARRSAERAVARNDDPQDLPELLDLVRRAEALGSP